VPAGSLIQIASVGYLEQNGNYVSIRASSPGLVLAAARALEPIPK
jgi:hypothetical protein